MKKAGYVIRLHLMTSGSIGNAFISRNTIFSLKIKKQ